MPAESHVQCQKGPNEIWPPTRIVNVDPLLWFRSSYRLCQTSDTGPRSPAMLEDPTYWFTWLWSYLDRHSCLQIDRYVILWCSFKITLNNIVYPKLVCLSRCDFWRTLRVVRNRVRRTLCISVNIFISHVFVPLQWWLRVQPLPYRKSLNKHNNQRDICIAN